MPRVIPSRVAETLPRVAVMRYVSGPCRISLDQCVVVRWRFEFIVPEDLVSNLLLLTRARMSQLFPTLPSEELCPSIPLICSHLQHQYYNLLQILVLFLLHRICNNMSQRESNQFPVYGKIKKIMFDKRLYLYTTSSRSPIRSPSPVSPPQSTLYSPVQLTNHPPITTPR